MSYIDRDTLQAIRDDLIQAEAHLKASRGSIPPSEAAHLVQVSIARSLLALARHSIAEYPRALTHVERRYLEGQGEHPPKI